MRKLNQYIGRTVVGAVAMVLLVIVALDAISALVDQLSEMTGNYNLLEVLIYVGLTLPARIYSQIPMSALIGCLVGLGILAGNSELTIMRAAGVSVWRISWCVMKPALLFIAISLTLGELVIPYTDQIADSRRSIAMGDDHALQSRTGLWTRDGEEFIHINAVLPNGKIYGVTHYRFAEDQRLLMAGFSEKAVYKGDHWLEQGIHETHMGESNVSLKHIEQREWRTELTPRVLNILVLEPDELSIRNLYSYAGYIEEQGVDNREYQLAFWQKLLEPLATASLVLIAVSFIFGPLREVTMGYRIFTGVIFGIVFSTTQDLLGPSSVVFGFSPLLAVLLPVLVCALFGLWLLHRAR